MCRESELGRDAWTKWQLFPWEELTYFPTEEVRPEPCAVGPEGGRQSDCEGSAVGPSCGEQGHQHRMLHEERDPGLQDFPTQCHRGGLVQTFELKTLSI